MTAEIHPTLTDRILVTAPFVMNEHIKSIPGRKFRKREREWTIPLSWTACLALRSEFPEMTLGPNLLAWGKKVGANKRWLRSRRLHLDIDPEDIHVNKLIMRDEFDWLYPHQKVDALSIYMAGGQYFNMNDVGTGKTAASLAGLRLLDIAHAESGSVDPFPVMVVAPKSMLRTWEREIRRAFPDSWGPDKRTISLVDGTPSKVKKALEPGFDFYIIGWELLRRYSRQAPYGSDPLPAGANVDKELQGLGLSTLIGDEIHRITTPGSQRSRAYKYMSHRVNFRIGLSGTGIEEGAVDLWHIFHCLFPHEYMTKTSYVERYLQVTFGEYGERIIGGLNPTREDEFRRNFEAVSRRMLIDIIPGLPDIIPNFRFVELPPKHRKAYNSMRDTLIAQVEGGTLTSPNQLVKSSRLVSLANSLGELTVNDDGTEDFTMTDDSPKLDALMEDITNGDYDGHPAVIFSESKQLLYLLAARLDAAKPPVGYTIITGDVTGEDRQTAIDDFQAGSKQFCLLTRAGGEGITLTAADTLIWLVRPWSHRVNVQVGARNRRIGSQIHKHINHVDYVVRDSIEEEKIVRLNSKGAAAEEVFQDGELLTMLRDGKGLDMLVVNDPEDET